MSNRYNGSRQKQLARVTRELNMPQVLDRLIGDYIEPDWEEVEEEFPSSLVEIMRGYACDPRVRRTIREAKVCLELIADSRYYPVVNVRLDNDSLYPIVIRPRDLYILY